VLTVRELARYLNCHPGTIYRFLKMHEIPAFRLGGGWRQNDNDMTQGPRKRSKKGRNTGSKAPA